MTLLAALVMAVGQYVPILKGDDPLDVKFVTSDIANFWKAYDAAKSQDSESCFRDLYFTPGTAGLKSFVFLRLRDPKSFSGNVEKMRPFFDSIPHDASAIDAQIPRMRSALLAFKNLYPEAKLPTVYFVVGQASTGGTTAPPGLLIGSEMYARTPHMDLSSLSGWQKRVIASSDVLPAIVAHEVVHYNQRGLAKDTLLAKSITEGAADFIGELSSGFQINTAIHVYGRAHEAELWKEFVAVKDGKDLKRWMYNGDQPERPADLGYFIGYRIVQAYYGKSKDKRAAIKAILDTTDFPKLLEESGYQGR
jgi:hypothetical protein